MLVYLFMNQITLTASCLKNWIFYLKLHKNYSLTIICWNKPTKSKCWFSGFHSDISSHDAWRVKCLNYLKLPAIRHGHLGLLAEAKWVSSGAKGSLHGVGEVWALPLNHQHRFDILSHFDNHFRCTLKGKRIYDVCIHKKIHSLNMKIYSPMTFKKPSRFSSE